MNGLLAACAALLVLVAAVAASLPALERLLCGPGHHRRPARVPGELTAWLRHPVASLVLWSRYRDWPLVQSHYLRRYRRADRRAFRAEMAVMTPAPAPVQAPRPGDPPPAHTGGVVRAGAAPQPPGDPRTRLAADAVPPSADAATAPQPGTSPGLGQPDPPPGHRERPPLEFPEAEARPRIPGYLLVHEADRDGLAVTA
jgi:hypothetical protein